MHTTDTRRALKRSALAAAGVLFLLPASASAQTSMDTWKACLQGAQPTTTNVVRADSDHDPTQDEVILDFVDSMSDAEIKAWSAKNGLNVQLNSPAADAPNIYVAPVAEGAVPYIKDCLAKRDTSGVLEVVEENFDYQLFGDCAGKSCSLSLEAKPNDPLYQFQWHFEQVNAEAAWQVSTGRDVVVAVIDTGVAVENNAARGIKKARDLAGTPSVPGYDFVDKSDFVFDGHGHGTHVAGTIAQTTNNGYGVAGLAYNAKIMGLRVLNSQGFGQVADIANSVRFAADNGAHVINMSLGGPLPSLVMKRAIDYAHKKGVTIVAAAGNSGRRSGSYPASYNHVISVAATQFDKSTTFYSQWHPSVDIAAPGGNTRVDQNNDGRPDGVLQQTLKEGRLDEHDFLLYMGTSMASPHVAAGAAMVIAQGITHPDKVEAILKKTADGSQSKRFRNKAEYKERYGAGIMQVDKAVKAAAGGQGGIRLVFSTFFALMALGMVRRRDPMGTSFEHGKTVVGVAAASGAGLFFLPWLFGDTALVSALAHPIAEMDMLVMGLGWHQSPITASILIPVLGYGLLGGSTRGRAIACGLALGMAGFLFSESLILTSDVRWIPGVNVLDRVWLAGNGAISLALGYFGMKRY